MSDAPDTDGLTDEQLIERVAVEVMGWKRREINRTDEDETWLWESDYGLETARASWNPLTDWNHTMEVEKAMAARGFSTYRIHSEKGIQVGFCFGLPRLSSPNIISPVVPVDQERRYLCLAALKAIRSSRP